jgi:hypothetical protein
MSESEQSKLPVDPPVDRAVDNPEGTRPVWAVLDYLLYRQRERYDPSDLPPDLGRFVPTIPKDFPRSQSYVKALLTQGLVRAEAFKLARAKNAELEEKPVEKKASRKS